jgi:predicted dehydrogenase
VVDRQVVNMEFEDGIVATFTMSPYNSWNGCGRSIRVMGTKGTISAKTSDKEIRFENSETGEITFRKQ